MFARNLMAPMGRPLNRLFSTNMRSFAAAPAARKAKDKKEENRANARRLMKRRAEQREPPQKHPLYMDVPTAMRYLRAAEVGKSPEKTTVSAHISLVPAKASAPVQGKIFFPKSIKNSKALVFVNNPESQAALQAQFSSIVVGGSDLVSQIKEGKFDFANINSCYADPAMVAELRSIAKILGPKGLMPSEKKGTVSSDLVDLVKSNFGAYNFKSSGESMAVPVGRCDFSDEEIIRNLKAASEAINASQTGKKDPVLLGRCHLSTTLGPSIVIDFRT